MPTRIRLARAAVEQAKRLDHPLRGEVLVEREGLALLRLGVHRGMPSPSDGHLPVGLVLPPEVVLLAALQVSHERDRADVAVGDLEVRAEELQHHAERHVLGGERAEHGVAVAGLDGGRRGGDHADGSGAAHVHRRAEGRLETELGGDARRPPVLLAHHRGHHDQHAVERGLVDAAVLDRPLRGFEGEAHGAGARHFTEAADADSRHRMAPADRHRLTAAFSSAPAVAISISLTSPRLTFIALDTGRPSTKKICRGHL